MDAAGGRTQTRRCEHTRSFAHQFLTSPPVALSGGLLPELRAVHVDGMGEILPASPPGLPFGLVFRD